MSVFKKKEKERWKLNLTVAFGQKERVDKIKKFLDEEHPEIEFDYLEFLEESFDKFLKRAEKEIEDLKSKKSEPINPV